MLPLPPAAEDAQAPFAPCPLLCASADLCNASATLVARLHQQGVRPALLLQCSSAAEAAACLAVLQAAAEAAGAPFSLAQPGQLPVAIRRARWSRCFGCCPAQSVPEKRSRLQASPSLLPVKATYLTRCRLALTQLAPAAPLAIAFVSLSESSTAASLAASLGCGAVEHLPARSTSPSRLQALSLQAVACLAASQAPVRPLVVGYVMKESRQLALAQQGMLPLLPAPRAAPPTAGIAPGQATAAGAAGAAAAAGEDRFMVFVPLDLGSSLAPQLACCQLVLQKLTDCLQPGGGGAVAELTPDARALLALQQQQQAQQQAAQARQQAPQQQAQQQQQLGQGQALQASMPVCLVDPAEALRPVMDRAALVPHLEQAALAVRQRAIPMRAPASLLLHRFDVAGTPRQLAAARVGLPCIVKPQAACGVAEAHQMAFVLHGWVPGWQAGANASACCCFPSLSRQNSPCAGMLPI